MAKWIQIFSFILFSKPLIAENILRLSCKTESAFYKIASNHALNDVGTIILTTTLGLVGCMDFCVSNHTCKAFNFKNVSATEALCELLPNDRTTKPNDVISKSGWSYYDTGLFSSQIGQYCRSLSYNPCYPCLCIDSCHRNPGYTCNCTKESPPLPDIYAAFETTVPNDLSKTAYDRGKDGKGNSNIILKNGAYIGQATKRPGKVLKIKGTNAGAVVGDFMDNTLNNPGGDIVSISLWLRILNHATGDQTVFGSGKMGSNTGILLRVGSNGQKIYAQSVGSTKGLKTPTVSVSDTLRTWSHIVVISNWVDGKLEIFINGRSVAKVTSRVQTSASRYAHPKLIIGAGNLFPLVDDYWNMQIDDFAVWNGHSLTTDEMKYIINKGFV